ncbi:hypothetical protein [Nocardia farcinica]|uniref:hypothetical protein n=1 Tax=Nocardia farcinica TaxID=37329 RepID=UPI002454BEB9|nr:hypothetical protein [Nocardia farcinica]
MSTNHPNRRRRNPNGSGSISRRKDGRYELKIFVTTPEGHRKRISIYRDTWNEADAERTRIKELERRGMVVEVTTMTVAEYLHYWLDEVTEPSVRGNTHTTYEGEIRQHIIPALGNHKIRTLIAAKSAHSSTIYAPDANAATRAKTQPAAHHAAAPCGHPPAAGTRCRPTRSDMS